MNIGSSTITVDGNAIAYCHTPGVGPGIVFLGGFMSDMAGTKALALEAWARKQGRAFTRFDYSGHGESEGRFEDGTIGRWAADAVAVLDQVTTGPQLLVGSSMGGWIALLVAKARRERLAGFVGIAAAPDFTEDMMWAGFTGEIRRTIEEDGVYYEPSEYGDEPYPITRNLIEDGRRHLVLRETLSLPFPVRLIQGMEDPDVPWETALTLARHISGDDVEVILVKNGDHRLSEPADLARLETVLESLVGEDGA